MAKASFETPRIPEFPQIPVVVEGTMAHSRPFVAAPDHQQALGFPGELVDDWHDTAIAKMGELLGRYRGLRVFLDSCVKCGACTDKCHYYLGTADPKNMPVARQDLLRKVYRRHFTLAGRLFPKLVGADDLVELRVKGALPRMQAFKEVVERNRVTHIAAICAICKSQFAKVLPFYGFEMDQILSVHQLVGDAIVLGGSD